MEDPDRITRQPGLQAYGTYRSHISGLAEAIAQLAIASNV